MVLNRQSLVDRVLKAIALTVLATLPSASSFGQIPFTQTQCIEALESIELVSSGHPYLNPKRLKRTPPKPYRFLTNSILELRGALRHPDPPFIPKKGLFSWLQRTPRGDSFVRNNDGKVIGQVEGEVALRNGQLQIELSQIVRIDPEGNFLLYGSTTNKRDLFPFHVFSAVMNGIYKRASIDPSIQSVRLVASNLRNQSLARTLRKLGFQARHRIYGGLGNLNDSILSYELELEVRRK